ncbi:helix-turn-helix transcriptional regulator [Xanthomonas campestris pv. incanae]|uniref:helix-turn-helix domain-containing protein n=1 Tax=Xanthomonas campestris TaxID=339 RepID=UPI0029C2113A|nr:helix-turn-helix transcriptional regulator [Xanthomonas campestris]MDX6080019.1 helix-turn-helix transcriptional regulator [Xanthomonas campestris pv. incanae]MDX6084669.1 helix-turn-helix transcriptional regulator [Xanthomonas campestris pv. incanae]MDX6138215.1 helix-turn-helix transcriptional regulator [Xanthomonas campestris pv. incanae]
MNTTHDRYALLALLLRDLRNQSDMTQTDLANALGKPQSYVSKYESGERRLDLIELSDLCSVLGISLYDFVSLFERGER